MSLDFLARIRAQGMQPAMACVTTDAAVAERWANHAGIWPVVVDLSQDYDLSPLADMTVILALPRLKGPRAERMAHAVMAVTNDVIGFDLDHNQSCCMVEA